MERRLRILWLKCWRVVLTRDEARRAFGKQLDKKSIQPVWIQIENNSDRDYWFMRHGLDPDYFSAFEAAYVIHGGNAANTKEIDDYFLHLRIDPFAPPGGSTSGFVFTNLKQGTKEVRVRLLGDKELFHRQSAQIPLIVVDPTDAADATRGSVCDAPVEAIDLVPTFIEWCGGEPPEERLEGASLLPWIRADADAERRSFVVSELDYSWRQQRRDLGLKPSQARAWMLRTDHWNYVYYEGFPPQLFDLRADPDELVDLGRDTGYAEIRRELADELFAWLRGRKVRATISEAEIERRTEAWRRNGVLAGAW